MNSSIIISKYEGEFNSEGSYHNTRDSVPSTLEKVIYNFNSDESQIVLSFKGYFKNGNYDIGTEIQVISEDLINSKDSEFTEHIGLKVNHKEYPLDCANTYIVEKIGRESGSFICNKLINGTIYIKNKNNIRNKDSSFIVKKSGSFEPSKNFPEIEKQTTGSCIVNLENLKYEMVYDSFGSVVVKDYVEMFKSSKLIYTINYSGNMTNFIFNGKGSLTLSYLKIPNNRFVNYDHSESSVISISEEGEFDNGMFVMGNRIIADSNDNYQSFTGSFEPLAYHNYCSHKHDISSKEYLDRFFDGKIETNNNSEFSNIIIDDTSKSHYANLVTVKDPTNNKTKSEYVGDTVIDVDNEE